MLRKQMVCEWHLSVVSTVILWVPRRWSATHHMPTSVFLWTLLQACWFVDIGFYWCTKLKSLQKEVFWVFHIFPNCLCALLLACFFAAPNCYLSFQVSLILVKLCAAMFMMLLMLIMKFVQPSSALSWWLWRGCVLPRRRWSHAHLAHCFSCYLYSFSYI